MLDWDEEKAMNEECGKSWELKSKARIPPRNPWKEHSLVKTEMLDLDLQDCKNKSAWLYGTRIVLIYYISVLRN